MSGGIYAFYAAHMPNTLNTIKSYSATFRMPFVTSGMAVNTSRQEVAYELYVRPQYSRALRDIIVKYGWSEIWYIYSSNEGRSVCAPQLFIHSLVVVLMSVQSDKCDKKWNEITQIKTLSIHISAFKFS